VLLLVLFQGCKLYTYIIKYFSPPVGWGYQLMLFGDKYKRGTGKGGKFERKRKKEGR
jgi:hypothetical protein